MALLFALYLLGGVALLFFSLGGLGIARGALALGQGESIARWSLATLFANGIGLSFLFGLGTRAAFSDQSLRHYPLSARERFIVRHVIGLLDPIWLIVVAGSLGLALGLAWTGMGSIVMGLPAVFLFVLAGYLAAAFSLWLADLIVESRNGAALFSALVILLVSFGPLAIASLAASHRFDFWPVLDQLLKFTPPGAAAAMMAGDSPLLVLAGAACLCVWCGGLAFLLLRLERRPRSPRSASPENISENDFYDRIGKTFGPRYGPLVSKSLRYHLRSNLIRFSLITSPIIVLMGKFLVPGRWQDKFFPLSLAIFFVMSSAAGATLMLNLFGFDGSGIRRYAILPIPFADALRAASIASVLLRAVTILVAIALWLLFYAANSLSWRMFAMILSAALASLFLFNGLGLWTSILAPKSLNFDAMWNNRLSFGANLVVFFGILVPIWGATFYSDRLDQALLTSYWWVSCLILIFCSGFYMLSLMVLDGLVSRRRERLINLIAGASER